MRRSNFSSLHSIVSCLKLLSVFRIKYCLLLITFHCLCLAQKTSTINILPYESQKNVEFISYGEVKYFNDSFPYLHENEIKFRDSNIQIRIKTDTMKVVNLNVGPNSSGYIVEPEQFITIKGEGTIIYDVIGTGNNTYGLKFCDWKKRFNIPHILGESIFQYTSSNKMISFYEFQMDRNIRKPLKLLIKKQKIDSVYYEKLMKIIEIDWLLAMQYNFQSSQQNISQRDFMIYLYKKYDPFDFKYDELTNYSRRFLVEMKANYISKGWIEGENNYKGIWKEKENVYNYIPFRLQPLVAINQLISSSDSEKFDFEYTNQIFQNFKKIFPNHPSITKLNKIYTKLAQEHDVNYVHTFGKYDNKSNKFRNIEKLSYNNINKLFLDKFKEKYVVVSIWADWCNNCIPQLMEHKNLKKFLDNENIEFLYITLDSEVYSGRWLKNIRKRRLDAWHYFPPLEMHSSIKSMAGLNIDDKLPRYIIIDKYGKVLFNKTLLPTDKEKMYQQIKKIIYR